MADILDVFGFRNLPPGRGSPIAGIPNFVPVPGDSDTGGFLSGLIDIFGNIITGGSPGLPALPPLPGGQLPPLPGTSGPGFTLGGPIPTNGAGCATDACCKGFHLNKSPTCSGQPAGSKCVRNRRMNALNPQALRRAIRRAKSFESFVKSNRKSLRSLAKI